MIDPATLAAYDRGAEGYAEEWHAQPPPEDLQALVRQYFRPGRTADIGCGSGRDAAWLQRNGFEVDGYDASAALLETARRRYPGLRVHLAALPELAGIADGAFANVLCETVIMHLPPDAVAPAVRRLIAILQGGGTLYLSWRVTPGADRRDEAGRLYAAFDAALVDRCAGDRYAGRGGHPARRGAHQSLVGQDHPPHHRPPARARTGGYVTEPGVK